jgi:hypothetical protein
MENTKKTPIAKFRDRALSVAVWQNISEDNNVRYSTTFEKQYKPEDGDWMVANSYSENDLLRIARLFNKAYDAISELKQSN